MTAYDWDDPKHPNWRQPGGDLDRDDEIHDVWGNRGEPADMYGQMEER